MRQGRLRYIGRRCLAACVSVFLIVTLNFVLFRAVPGDAADALHCRGCTAQFREQFRQHLGLGKPLTAQYWIYLRQIARGDLGTSISMNPGEPVSKLVWPAVGNTIPLVASAMIIAVVGGLFLGLVAVKFRGSIADRAAVFGGLVFYATPSMWIGMIAIILFAGTFPVAGATNPLNSVLHPGLWSELQDRARHLVLPTLTLAVGLFGQFVLITRSAVVQTLGEDYILTARAKGLTQNAILRRYAFRNGALPITALIALTAGAVITGTILVETVFSYPGIGELTVNAVSARDYPVLEAAFLVLAVSVVRL